MTVEDVAARARMNDAALCLDALGVGVVVRAPQLLVGEPSGEEQQEHREDEVEEQDPRVAAVTALDRESGHIAWEWLGHLG